MPKELMKRLVSIQNKLEYMKDNANEEDFVCKVYDSLDKAIAEAATDVYNEIGWEMDDLEGRFEEVCGYLRSGQTYSFADIVWQIKEIGG